eukprot:snap_masked-scaffold_13-processed-gene-9.34-mRNA-1 protein AED:0.01 eAED:0.01 QI:0/-1/0/1/-1/1/1/0/343
MFEISIAPMMEVTTRHFRYLSRLLSSKTILYTEMVVSSTIVHRKENLDPWLGFSKEEKPVVLQLGGNDPKELEECAKIALEYGYDEINLNCGCPSSKVAGNEFGASLMLNPTLVREIYLAMKRGVDGKIPVTIKCRLGCDDQDEYEHVKNFVNSIPECDHFIVHARNCILKGLGTKRGGLSPDQNRKIPKLKPDYVFKLVEDFPEKKFTLNGELKSLEQVKRIKKECPKLAGAMFGRQPWKDLSFLSAVDEMICEDDFEESLSREQVIKKYIEYCETNKDKYNLASLMKPLASLVTNVKNGKRFRKIINQADIPKNRRTKNFRQIAQTAMSVLPKEYLQSKPQ